MGANDKAEATYHGRTPDAFHYLCTEDDCQEDFPHCACGRHWPCVKLREP